MLRRPRALRAEWLALATALALGACAFPALGVDDREVAIQHLGVENWTPAAGLAGSWVRSIAATSDGFLWIATSGGLSRFDGHTFVNFTAAHEPALPANGIAALAPRAAGGLWLALDAGGLRVIEGGRIHELPELAPLEALKPVALLESPPGTLWIATTSGLRRWREGRLDAVAPPAASDPAEIRHLIADPRGGLWVRTREDGIWRIEGDAARRIGDPPSCLGFDLALTADGRPVTACVNGVWERKTTGAWELVGRSAPNKIFVDRSGALWIAGTEALERRGESGWESLSSTRLGDSRVRAFLEDGSGNLWVGTYSAGLSRLRQGAVTSIGAAEGLAIDGPTGVTAARDDTLWVGSARSGALRWSAGRGVVERWDTAKGLPSDWVFTIAEDPLRPGRIWIGTYEGLVELTAGVPRLVPRPEGRTHQDVRLLYADPRRPGTLWAGGAKGGLDEIREDGVRRHDARNGLGLARVRELRRLRSGQLLAAGEEGLFGLDGERWRKVVAPAPELGSIRTFVEQPDGTLWLASPRFGVVRWQGETAVRFGEPQGLPDSALHSLALDRAGDLWLSSDEGIARIRTADFERWQRGELDTVPIEQLSARDGLRDRECNGWGYPAATLLADGRLLYPTNHGVALVDPTRLATTRLAAEALYLDRAWTGDRMLPTAAPWRLGPRERHLRVAFGAREFLRPEAVQFRYLLEGLDPQWIAAGETQQVNYAYVPPGTYRFRLQGRLPGQEWVAAHSVAEVRVDPRFWESPELRLFALAAALGLALGLYAWRTRMARRHALAIRNERALLREVIDTSPNPIFAKGRDLTYSLANRAAAAVYGLAPRDLIGRGDAELARQLPELRDLEAADREVLRTGEEQTIAERRVVDAAGITRWFRVVKRPQRGSDGEVERILGTAVDVTDFKLAELGLRRREVELRARREELGQLARQLIRAQEDERSRLAREIHDDLTQRLAGLAMLTGSLARAAAQGPADRLPQRLGQVREELEKLASDAQSLSRELHPSLLANLGLEAALRAECATFHERTGMRVHFESRHVPAGLPAEESIAFYRITQEALRNALTHAAGAAVYVALEGNDQGLWLRVEDEGPGFDPSAVERRPGIGLASMAERARLIGGTFELDAVPERGTRIVVCVPLSSPAEDGSGAE